MLAETRQTIAAIDLRPEKIFLLLGCVFGLVLTFLTPPFQSPDEYNHLYRAYYCSEGHIFPIKRGNILGGELPDNLSVSMQPFLRLMYKYDEKISWRTIDAALQIQIDPGRRTFVDFSNTALYSPLGYLPQTAGVLIGRFAGGAPLVMMYLGRLLNLMAWLLLVYWAIKITPIHKWFLAVLALMPMSIFLAPTLSVDAMTNGVSFLLLAMVLYLTYDNTVSAVSNRHLGVILACGIYLILSKIAYSPLILLYFLIPATRFSPRRIYLQKTMALVAIISLVFIGWSLLTAHLHVPLETPGASVRGQAMHIMNHPPKFVAAIVDSYGQRYLSILMSFIGVLGWLDTPLPHFHFIGYLFLLFIVAIVDSDNRIHIDRGRQLYILTVLVISWLILIALVFMVTAPVGATVYYGIQGRWHIPLAPVFFLLFYNRQINTTNSKLIGRVYLMAEIVSLSLVITSIVRRFYVL
jgi:uncharacterized membrane protein